MIFGGGKSPREFSVYSGALNEMGVLVGEQRSERCRAPVSKKNTRSLDNFDGVIALALSRA